MKFLKILLLFFPIWMSLTGQLCTKKIVHGKDYQTSPKVVYVQADQYTVLAALQKSLDRHGFEILNIVESGHITTGWRPVEVDSHYVPFFERKDYGFADGAYYQLLIDFSESGTKMKVALHTVVKSIAGKIESSGKVEGKIIKDIKNYLKSPQIELTNVGVEDR